MTTLDDRARFAAEAVHRSVAAHVPATPLAVVARRRTIARGVGWTAATVAAAAVFAVVVLVAAPDADRDATESTDPPLPTTTVVQDVTPTTPPTVPAPSMPSPPSPSTTVPAAGAVPTTEPSDTTPPPLSIDEPADGERFNNDVVTFRGTTEPGATVLAAGKFPAAVDGEGHWSVQLVLAEGPNRAAFVATDPAGNTAEASVVVYYDPPPPPPEEPPPSVGFTAFQTYGSCTESPPYDVFYGTADPNTTVQVISAYGSGSVVADAAGNWEIRVTFPTAPYGVGFDVKVRDHEGATETFEFVSYSGG